MPNIPIQHREGIGWWLALLGLFLAGLAVWLLISAIGSGTHEKATPNKDSGAVEQKLINVPGK
jgi:hypothetical protein